jgi:hypothetical protein
MEWIVSDKSRLGGLLAASLLFACVAGEPHTSLLMSEPQRSAPPVKLRVDAGQPLRPISPLIYGVAVAAPEELSATGARLHRWGGNPNSRYNWEHGSAWNAARDWEFRNYGTTHSAVQQPSALADSFVATNRAAGAESLVAIPALGWVARDGDSRTRSVGVPPGGGLPLGVLTGAIAGYDPSANREATSIRSFARKGGPFADPPDGSDGRVYQDEWVHHLVSRFGSASAGGVRYYAIDNEPDLWGETHTDVHPVQPGYDDMLATFLAYAEAIKDVDPAALVLGPALSGWTGYFYSGRDRGTDNFRTHADRRAHGDIPFLPWWLDQVRQHDERVGRRTLDVLDVHYYPQGQGIYSGATDNGTNALRLRSTRSLWDSRYPDESWIREPVQLIPRLREWIDRYYPGTLLAIGEWNWGAERTMNGALAIADVLGIFGREGVDLAAYWTTPPRRSPGALAFALYTNYDGRGGAFGDLALSTSSDAPDDVAAYGSIDIRTGDLVIVAINKRPDVDLLTTFHLEGFVPSGQARLYRYGEDDPLAIRDLGDVNGVGRELSLTLPRSSITLVRVLTR